MRPDFAAALAEQQTRRQSQALQRQLHTAKHARPGRIVIGGRELIDFGSNDYLGLARDPRLIQALREAAAMGLGARASHLLGGHHEAHVALEAEIAAWIGYPRVLLFGSGYAAAQGALTALLGRHDLCIQDRLNHACLLDGARLASAELRRYAHGDARAAAELLAAQPARRALLVSDSVFSMDGDVAPLQSLAALAGREGAWLMVDEAHGWGVLGPEGRGACAAAGLGVDQVPVWMGTLGKALGGYGAVIAGSELLIDTLINSARSYIYTTALPPVLAQVMRTAVQIARAAEAERATLMLRIAELRAGLADSAYRLLPSDTAIQPLLVGDSAAALALSAALRAAGFYCPAVRPPTVPVGQARLRISLSAAHSAADVAQLVAALTGAKSGG